MTSRSNPTFARAAVNYHWSLLMGRGFTPTVDDLRDEDEPTHPALFRLLTEEFRASGHDLKHLLRAICNSQTYQRASIPLDAAKKDSDSLFDHAPVKVMTPEAMYNSVVTALGIGTLNPAPKPTTARKGKNSAKTAPVLNAREQFVKLFGTKDGTGDPREYTHGIPQLLKLLNGEEFHREPPLVASMVKEKQTREQAVERLYLATLSRRPSSGETRLMTDYLAKKSSHSEGYTGVLWILLNSSEFILNH
jgi:hypothetical protein